MEGTELEPFGAWLCGSVVLPFTADGDTEGGVAAGEVAEKFFWWPLEASSATSCAG